MKAYFSFQFNYNIYFYQMSLLLVLESDDWQQRQCTQQTQRLFFHTRMGVCLLPPKATGSMRLWIRKLVFLFLPLHNENQMAGSLTRKQDTTTYIQSQVFGPKCSDRQSGTNRQMHIYTLGRWYALGHSDWINCLEN